MARNGSGVYVLPPSNPVSSGTVIESTWANDTMSDIANALTQSISGDGQTVPTNNLPMGGFHHTDVSDPTSRNQYSSLGMVQDGRHQRVQITSGVDNLVGTLVGGATAYVAGALVSFFAPATNTGNMTLNYNGIGAKSLVDQNGIQLAAGEITAGEFVLALYTGTEFRLITTVNAAVAADLYNLSITGQNRPVSGLYPALTIATASTINVPAGTAWIVPPGNDTDNAVQVSWATQTITLQFLTTSFTTIIAVDNTGSIQQVAGRATGANFRGFAVLGVVEHIGGAANQVITRPAIFGDDGYRNRDVVAMLANTIINGGLVTPNNVSTLQLDVAQGTIFVPGGTANTIDNPNTFNVPPQQNIPFRPLAGQNTLSALTSTVPVGSYDANGAGIVAALPNPGDATIHRLFYLYGQYVLAYGQQVYSSVENALSMIEWDRTKFKKSLYLADATLMAEVVAIRTATNLNLIAQGAVVCPGGLNISIGSPGGIAEAPIDGTPYGRKDAAWSQVLSSVSPSIGNDATITGAAPKLNLIMSPYAAGTNAYNVFAAANKWFAIETVNPDDKTYFRSYNPTNGALRSTTTYDLATGRWTFPEAAFVSAAGSTTDTAAGRLMKVEDFGLGGNAAPVTDVDLLVDTGFYIVTGSTLGVLPTTTGTLFHMERGSSNSAFQLLDTLRSPGLGGIHWVRTRRSDGIWSTWREIWHTGNLVKQTSATDTTAGSVMLNGAHGLGGLATNNTISDFNGVDIVTFARSTGSSTNSPIAADHNLLNVASSALTNTQIAMPWNSSLPRMFIRSQSTTYSPWAEVWTSKGNNIITSTTGGLGFGTGSGGSVTQLTSKATAVTLNTPSGRIISAADSLAAGASATFILNNSVITSTDLMLCHLIGVASSSYRVETLSTTTGSARIRITNLTGGALAESMAIGFALIKVATS